MRQRMVNHPNRSKHRTPGAKYNAVRSNPKPEDVRAAREAAGLTQTQAAETIYATLRSWQDWESGERRMHPGLFELFELKLAMPDAFEMFNAQRGVR